MILSNKIYDGLKWVTLVLLPAISVFYLALAQSWNLPYPIEVAATIAAVDVFIAALIGMSTSNYKIYAATLNFNAERVFGNPNKGLFLSKVTYDILTWVAQILLPSMAALYFTLAGLWNLPYPEMIVSTIMAFDTFLGMLLGFSTSQFHKQVATDLIDIPAGISKVSLK
jgi:hypothetical protein